MSNLEPLSNFFTAIENDPCINTTHISLYMALLQCWKEQAFIVPIHIFSNTIMQKAKISSSVTYFKTVKDLSDFGYIKYVPSYNPNQGSKIYMLLQ